MATYQVELLANNPPDWDNPRQVEIPDDPLQIGLDIPRTLELIFHYGQNDIQPRKCCSVSVGDVAQIPMGEGVPMRYYICKPTGWAEISRADLEAYRALDQRSRRFSKYVHNIRNASGAVDHDV